MSDEIDDDVGGGIGEALSENLCEAESQLMEFLHASLGRNPDAVAAVLRGVLFKLEAVIRFETILEYKRKLKSARETKKEGAVK